MQRSSPNRFSQTQRLKPLFFSPFSESNPVYDLADRVNDIYGAVLESEECMEKIACELGGMAKDLTASPVAG